MNITSFIKLIKQYYPKEDSTNTHTNQYSIAEIDTTQEVKSSLIKEFTNSKFTLPNEITMPFINNKTSHHIKISYDKIILNCVAPYKETPPLRYLLRIVKRLVCLTRMFSIDKTYTIWLLPMNHNRRFPDGTQVEPIHINGGFTYVQGTTIYVYRYEECAKVLLHELLHHSPFDTHGKWTNDQINGMRSVCSIHNTVELNINEAIVEFWAVLFECLFVSYEYEIPYKMLIKKEQDWSILQTAKLLKYKDKYFTLWQESTNAYCYIVLKTLLLTNYEDFLKISVPYTTSHLYDFIVSHYNKNIKNKKVATNHKVKIENTSMRMTLFGDI